MAKEETTKTEAVAAALLMGEESVAQNMVEVMGEIIDEFSPEKAAAIAGLISGKLAKKYGGYSE